jgi:hypothetical protein
MNIGILGAGTASAICILTILNMIKTRQATIDDLSITCIHDPDKPTAQVGESTSGMIYSTMGNVLDLDFNEDLDVFDGTLRHYTQYKWALANGNDFVVHYDSPGIHLNSEKWSSYIFEKLKIKYENFIEIHDDIHSTTYLQNNATAHSKTNSYTFDFLIDCRGTPTAEELASEQYIVECFETVNSVILFPDFKNYQESFTSSYIHENGWMFGVPLQHRKAFGYLYNNKSTSYDEAVEHFSKLKDIDASKLRNFSWKPYHKKTAMDGRVLSMGNRLYLYEPQQAVPLHYYVLLTTMFIKGINAKASIDQLTHHINEFNTVMLENIRNLLAFSYCGENNIDSKFWNDLRIRSTELLQTSDNWQTWLHKVDDSKKILGYAPADSSMMRTYLNGFKVDLNKTRRKNIL